MEANKDADKPQHVENEDGALITVILSIIQAPGISETTETAREELEGH